MVNIIIDSIWYALFSVRVSFLRSTSNFCGFVGALVSVRAFYCVRSECFSESVRRDQF